MKTSTWIRSLGFAAITSMALANLPDTVVYKSPKAEIVFPHPDKYKDIKDAYMATEKGEKANLDILGNCIVEEANDRLPAGDKLTMEFTDVDLAGDFEPWRGAQADDVRIVRDLYPPDYKFTWKVTDAAGKVLKEGTEDLRDIDFQMKVSLDDSTPLKPDKAELRDWLSSHLRGWKQ